MDDRSEQPPVRLVVRPGEGRIARRENCLLFVPDDSNVAPDARAELVERFGRDGPTDEVRASPLPRCIIAWGAVDDPIGVDSTVDLHVVVAGTNSPTNYSVRTAGAGRFDIDPEVTAELSVIVDAPIHPGGPGDLRDGDVPAGGFELFVPSMNREHIRARLRTHAPTEPTSRATAPAEVTAEPEQFDELTDLDVTLTPIGPVSYPEDDTDRTFRRPNGVRCARGHANANTNITCRVCGESLDSTASRSGPRASTAVAGVRLPDGSVIPINRMLAIGRSPTAQGARLDVTPRLVAIDAPTSVSRTHVLLRLDGDLITVTDCDSRGRTAIVSAGQANPTALAPWTPRPVGIGDAIQLGGPTTLTITDPAELRVPPAFEPTARPSDQNEST